MWPQSESKDTLSTIYAVSGLDCRVQVNPLRLCLLGLFVFSIPEKGCGIVGSSNIRDCVGQDPWSRLNLTSTIYSIKMGYSRPIHTLIILVKPL